MMKIMIIAVVVMDGGSGDYSDNIDNRGSGSGGGCW